MNSASQEPGDGKASTPSACCGAYVTSGYADSRQKFILRFRPNSPDKQENAIIGGMGL